MTMPSAVMTKLDPSLECRIQLGDNHGYQIDGDQLYLYAELQVPAALQGSSLSLELWACQQPYLGGELYGSAIFSHNLSANSGEQQCSGPLHSPTGSQPWNMVLLACSIDANGQRQIHDYCNYPQLQQFYQPLLHGGLNWQWQGNCLHGQIDAISNPRLADNLSGSLVLSLWSVALPYHGGPLAGEYLGGVSLGQLAGGQSWQPLPFSIEAKATEARPGEALLLVLSEWGPLGQQPRDLRVLVPAAATTEAATTVAATAEVAAPAKAETAVAVAKPVAATKTVAETSTKSDTKITATKAADGGKVSINQASVAELAAVKGLSVRLAQAIVDARPHASLDSLLAVKGIGQRLLSRIRALLHC